MFKLGGKKVAVGVDIGSGSFRVAKLMKGKDKPILVSIGSIRVPRGAIVGGEIVDMDVVAQSLIDLWKKIGIREKEVVLGIANQRTIVRLIDFPYMEKNELVSAIQFQAQDFIPLPMEDVILDYQTIGEYYSESGDRMLQILLVAAQKGMIETFVRAAEKAGLKPSIIDIDAFAAARSLLATNTEEEVEPQGIVSEKVLKEAAEEKKEATIDEVEKETGGVEEDALEKSFEEENEINEEMIEGLEEKQDEDEEIRKNEEQIEVLNEEEIQGQKHEEEYKAIREKKPPVEAFEIKTQKLGEENIDLISQEKASEGESEPYDFSDEKGDEPEIANDGGEEARVGIIPEVASAERKDVTAIIDVSAGITNIMILEGVKVRFVRIVNIGGDDCTEAIVELLGVSLDEAEDLKVRIGLPPLSGDKYIDVPGDLVDRADAVFSSLEREVIKFIGEIRRSFEYYTSQSGGSEVQEVIVSGGASSLKNFTNYMERGLGVKVIRGNPITKVEVPPRLREQLVPGEEGSYSIAIGLALRGLE